jgi:aminoglycoside phosphotransferase (APT) family kinase protein
MGERLRPSGSEHEPDDATFAVSDRIGSGRQDGHFLCADRGPAGASLPGAASYTPAVFARPYLPVSDRTSVVPGALHHDELRIDLPLVRALVDRAQPDLAALPLRQLERSGSTNALFRLGDDLVVRLPRQGGGSAAIDKEATWLPLIAPSLPVAVPAVVGVGDPGFGYPERWSLVRWLDGSVPSVPEAGVPSEPPRRDLARDLAEVVAALGEIDVTPDALAGPALRWYRGDSLATRDAPTRDAIAACRDIDGLNLELDEVSRVWRDAMRLPDAQLASGPRWYHGDLFAENLLVRDGQLTAILDFGGLGIGDPTIDLIVAWEALDAAERDAFREAITVDEPSWLRARAWALSLAIITFPYYWRTMPARCASQLAVANPVLADALH